ncbi:ABC transporter substrate-binding protein, partial [Methylobacterium radiotolerans]|uniref:ABC transporter substrate-binding protein n=1 Tax=Methylobacterium radiotolerans TaxID=31998 RepID=UPI001FD8BAC6
MFSRRYAPRIYTCSERTFPAPPLFVAQLPLFSAAYYAGRDFEASTLEAPLGSGPYRVGAVDAGRSIGLERVPDYWAAELPVNVGQNNFDAIPYAYFPHPPAAPPAPPAPGRGR